MANPIRFKDFADLSDAKEAGKIFDDLEKDILKSFTNIGTVTKKQLEEINQSIVKLRDSAKSLDFKGSQGSVKPMIQEYENLSNAQKRVIETLKGIAQTEDFAAKSIQGLKNEAKLLQKEFDKLVTSENSNTESAKKLADQIRKTKAEAFELANATKRINNEFSATAGSYNALTVQNRKLNEELRQIPFTVENGVTSFGKFENKAKELQEQIRQNTDAQKKYDAEIGRNFRNVGNYAESIIQAKNALDQQKGALQNQVAALQNQLKATKGNADIQNKLQSELRETRTELQAINSQLTQYGVATAAADNGSKKFSRGLQNVALQLAGAYLGITGIQQAARFFVDTNAEISDSLADVRKTTGLTDQEVQNLLTTIKQFNTRTSIQGLLDISKIGGQLGIAGKDIAGFTKAVDVAAVALGDEFAGGIEEISSSLGKINAVYKVTEEYGVEQGILRTGSAINALGAAGLATAPYLADFTQRLGGIASNTDQSVQNILGLAAASEELGQSSEVAAGVITQIFSKMSTESAKFARVAGLSLSDFEDLVNKDINAAFIKVLEGLQKSSGSTTEFSRAVKSLGLEGVRATGVLGALSANTALIAEKQALSNVETEKAISLTDEAAIKNDTFGASLDKLNKSFVSLSTGQNGFTNFLKVAAEEATGLIQALELLSNSTGSLDFMNRLLNSFSTESIAAFNEELRKPAQLYKEAAEKVKKENDALINQFVKGGFTIEEAQNKTLNAQIGSYERLNAQLQDVDGAISYRKQLRSALDHESDAYKNQTKEIAKLLGRKRNLTAQQEYFNNLQKGTVEAINDETEALELSNEQIKASILLEKSRLEIKLKINKEIQADDKTSVFERLSLIRQEKDLRIKIADLEKKALLTNDKLLADERIMILEKFAEEVRSINKDITTKLKLDIEFELPEIEEEGFKLFDSDTANKELEFNIKQQIKAVEDARSQGLISEKEYQGALSKIEDERLLSIIENLKAEFGYTEDILDLEIALRKKKGEEITENEKKEQEKRDAIKESSFEVASELLNAISTITYERYERETAALELKKDTEIKNLEETAAYEKMTEEQRAKAKEQINQTFAKKELQLRRQQAKRDKALAMFGIALDTARAIMAALTVPPPAGPILAAANAAIGAIQLGVVAARPLPAFERGTKNAPEGLAVVGEKGFELVERRGKFIQTNDGPQIMPLKKGDKVYTHKESIQMIKDSEKAMQMNLPLKATEVHERAVRNVTITNNHEEIIKKLALETKMESQRIVNAIKSQPVASLARQADKIFDVIEHKNSRRTYLNKYKK